MSATYNAYLNPMIYMLDLKYLTPERISQETFPAIRKRNSAEASAEPLYNQSQRTPHFLRSSIFLASHLFLAPPGNLAAL